MRKVLTTLRFSVAISALMVGGGAFAAAQPEDEAGPVATEGASSGDIIVTARRRAEDVGKVPLSITAFSGEQIEERGIESVQDLVKLAPGLNINGAGTRANPVITLRGQTRGITGLASPGVIVYFNDVPLQNQGSLIQTFDMENVQVLKGPQGTLFGRNALGGAVLTNSKSATHDFNGYGQVEVGSYGFRQVEGAVNLPIIDNVLAIRLAGQASHIDGWTKTYQFGPYSLGPGNVAIPGQLVPNDRDYEQIDSVALRGSILFEPVDGIKSVTVLDYNRQRGVNGGTPPIFFQNGVPGVANPAIWTLSEAQITAALSGGLGATNAAIYANNIQRLFRCGTSIACDVDLFAAEVARLGDSRVQFTNNDPDGLVKLYGVMNTTSFELGDHATIKNIVSWRHNQTLSKTDSDSSPMPIVYATNTVKLQTFTEELQISGEVFNDKLKYVFGGFYLKTSPHGNGGFQSVQANIFTGLSNPISAIYLTDTSKAVYGQLDYSLDALVEGLTLTAGARQTWDKVKACVASGNYGLFTANLQVPGTIPVYPTEEECLANDTSIARFPGAARRVNENFLAEFDKLTWQFGANWQINPDALVYITARRGYRSGGFNVPLFNPFLAPVQNFGPETLDDIEVGTKLRWNSGGMFGSFDLAVYRGKDKDVQFNEATSGVSGNIPGVGTVSIPSPNVVINKANLTISGFEVAGTISPIEGLTLGANASYTKIKVDSLTVPPVLAQLLAAAGRTSTIVYEPQSQPKWTAGANLNYVFPGEVLGGELSFNADLKYSDRFKNADFFVPSYKVVDARILLANIGDQGIDVSVYARNLLNENYVYGSFGWSAPLGAKSDYRGAPRTVGLLVRYKFGQ